MSENKEAFVEFKCDEGCDIETGTCAVCDGDKECSCACSHCGSNDNWHDCGHCDGEGVCEDWTRWRERHPGALAAQKAQRGTAERDWTEFMEEQSFKPTLENFRAAWRKMFGAFPTGEAETQWKEKVTRLSKAADVHVQL